MINGVHVPLGKTQMINFNIARLPSGTQIDLPVYVYRSQNPGPTLLLNGGLHGDEVNGIEIIRRMIFNDYFKNLSSGNVIAIPILNIYGFLNFSRQVPDGKDINRNFPGSTTGSLASRVAHFMSNKILPLADYGIDFHTGGASRHNHPQTRHTGVDLESSKLANAFSAPIQLISPLIDKSIRKQAFRKNIPFLVYEGGEAMRIDEFSIQEAIEGTVRVMHYLGLKTKSKKQSIPQVYCDKSSWVRARSSGIFILNATSGQYIERGDLLGTVSDPFGNFKVKVKAPHDGYIIGHNNMPVINQGDALFHIGIPAIR
tara:strand:+ start:4954 stop:5895 length:942 start_codon:yes stop_codon:yes gene_type:complete